MHDLNFRAATAIFGHLGIEWDLTKASAAELTELAAWISLYKEHRALLLSGDLVRVDHPDQSLVAGGVVAADQSSALFSFASVGRSEVVSLGRLRFPGLDPARRYRVTPLMLESAPSGLRPPLWWGVTIADPFQANVSGAGITPVIDGTVPEIELPGAVLSNLGLAPAQIDPEHALLYYVEATT